MGKLLKIADVAELTQLTIKTVYGLVSKRTIPFVKLNARVLRFDENEIRSWIEKKKVAAVRHHNWR